MNKKPLLLTFCMAFIALCCSKDDGGNALQSDQRSAFQKTNKLASASAKGSGAQQVSGISFFAEDAECEPMEGDAYALRMTGSLQGCLYTFVDEWECSPSGTYNGQTGTFWTAYNFEAKYEGCAIDGSYVGLEIKGRCQHPITAGSGTGVFEGVTGRLDMKDDIAAGNYPYRGHFSF
jgi:hypothetical protein